MAPEPKVDVNGAHVRGPKRGLKKGGGAVYDPRQKRQGNAEKIPLMTPKCKTSDQGKKTYIFLKI